MTPGDAECELSRLYMGDFIPIWGGWRSEPEKPPVHDNTGRS